MTKGRLRCTSAHSQISVRMLNAEPAQESGMFHDAHVWYMSPLRPHVHPIHFGLSLSGIKYIEWHFGKRKIAERYY